jgi:hypothetical protein
MDRPSSREGRCSMEYAVRSTRLVAYVVQCSVSVTCGFVVDFSGFTAVNCPHRLLRCITKAVLASIYLLSHSPFT